MPTNVESMFRNFVRQFGGTVIPEGKDKSADFVFPGDRVVAELKTLEEDAKAQHDAKMQRLVDSWKKRRLLIVYGRTVIRLARLNPICQREWLAVLQPPVENIIRDASRQLRSTKKSLSVPDAKGLLLIANDGNFLHTNPEDYMLLVSRVLQKKDSKGSPRFPDIRGVIYFSYRIGSKAEGLPFWMPGLVNLLGDADLGEFQDKLKRGWFSYLAGLTGLFY